MSSLSAIKATTHSRSLEDQAHTERHRDILVLILSHLQSNGYIDTATALLHETRSIESLARYEVADNIDLVQVLKEYDEYYKMRNGRRPVFCRSSQNNQMMNGSDEVPRKTQQRNSKRRSTRGDPRGRGSTDHTTLPPLSTNQTTPSTTKPLRSRKRALSLQGEEKCCGEPASTDTGVMGFSLNSDSVHRTATHHDTEPLRHSLKPMPNFDGDPELRALAQSIRRDIVEECPRVAWSDIVGLDDAKRLLKEAIILPRKYPQLFTGLRSPWKSVLLYGLPGTGKTLLARAVATESDTTFFNISASSIVSKYRGDSEKLIRMLFELARHYAPSTIFLDEVDSLMCHRGGGNGSSANEGSEHESSRRMKTELLVQMDGLLTNNSDVFVMAASNLPWDLDPAFLRRMEKRILIPLPAKESRKDMIRSHLSEFSPAFLRNVDSMEKAASLVDGYSGSDIKAFCKETAMTPLRRMLQHAEVADGSLDNENLSILLRKNPVTADDFYQAIASMNHSTSTELCERLKKWSNSHGISYQA